MDKAVMDIRYDLIKFMSLFHRLFTPSFKTEIDSQYTCSKNQVRAIMIIGRSQQISPTVLGKCMDMEKGSITSLVDSLEAMNLAYRQDDLEDKRKTWIHLTSEGKNYYSKQEENFIQQIKQVFKSLSQEELINYSKDLKNVVAIMEKVRDENGYTRR